MRTSAILERVLKLLIIMLPVLAVAVTALYDSPVAQTVSREMRSLDVRFINLETTFVQSKDKWLYWYKAPESLKKYFAEKYKKQLTDISSELRKTPRGTNGYLHLGGHISNYTSQAGPGDRAARSRSIAKAFLTEEAEMLGIPDVSELREQPRSQISMGKGGEFTHLYYMRYIGELPLEDSFIHIGIAPDDTIWFAECSLVPSPSKMYEATAHKTIAEDEARRIMENDARTKNPATLRKIEIYAIPSAPFAIWKGTVYLGGGRYWMYELNAFTGEIVELKKRMHNEGC